ncbi:MAG: HNH endonuclease [Acidobacteria bacterium]|nr:HNH endonuclease [Acidobacteriota bacterium]MBI3489661.1 HNH endonuclease [Acidobacteriota bacterium]
MWGLEQGRLVDPIIPRSEGGPSAWANLVACCRECNARKSGRTPEQAGMQLRSSVRSQRALLMDRLNTLAQA